MAEVYLVGAYSTRFAKMPERSYKDLTREAYEGVLADAALPDGRAIEMAWFGNCSMHTVGQGNIRGQVCMTPLVREGRFPERVPTINVEGGCATASFAFHGAWKDVLSGQSHCSLAIGVEKIFTKDEAKLKESFDGAIDQFDSEEWLTYYARAGGEAGKAFEPGPGRTIFMDTYAMQAAYHMKRWGTTQAQIAAGAAKNHNHAVDNDLAQYRFPMTVEQVMQDRPVTFPFTRAMCAPIGDGAAAALLCSGEFLKGLDPKTRDRAIKVRASALSGGKYRRLDEPGLSRIAADKAYRMAGISPDDIDLAEVHDATSFCEIYQAEMLRFCPEGQGGAYVASGATTRGGETPINVSGGLVSKGHPVGATGLSMIDELARQLRGEAGKRQVDGARIALAENGGGVIGFDEAACSVIVLERG